MWATILLCLPFVLWTVYCILGLVHQVDCHGSCIINFCLMGLGMLGYGLYVDVGAFVGVGALFLFAVLLGYGVHFLVEHLDRKRQAEKEAAEGSKE